MANTNKAQHWIDKLQLQKHVEGGSFKEVYKAALLLPQEVLTQHHKGARAGSTAIYFLLKHDEFSAFHRIASDEVWHHYDGDVISIYEITENGTIHKHLLGKELDKGETFIVVIPAGSWFGARVEVPGGYGLCGCTVAPGFDFSDFELADRQSLTRQYPAHAEIITALTRIS